jgi:hypothetical protein
MGIDGGYVRRSRTSSRPNAGAGDGDATSRAIVTGAFDTAGVVHAGTGRSYADGEGSWIALSDPSNAANTAAHAHGVTLGNQHPDFSDGGVTGAHWPTAEQVNCLVEFLNYMDGCQRYFADIDAAQTRCSIP